MSQTPSGLLIALFTSWTPIQVGSSPKEVLYFGKLSNRRIQKESPL
jgi:hypothetical protein